MDSMLGFAAGVMIAASFWSLLAPGIEMAQQMGQTPWLTGGVCKKRVVCLSGFCPEQDKLFAQHWHSTERLIYEAVVDRMKRLSLVRVGRYDMNKIW